MDRAFVKMSRMTSGGLELSTCDLLPDHLYTACSLVSGWFRNLAPSIIHLQHVRCAPKLEPSLETVVEVPLATGTIFCMTK